ncbi:LEAF RUST 10 DISEASE-RESISTANCE LOCUS RECEPTOR-LIKE PROTEIN KINASE-like 1.2 [Chenopodium quinoa]|uniref:LEAF RUST 10 DISEASE-RESISTANCE LOCUS RECEPTOR-LIKE PROTEIN KINASE-like 1.2 n=1 Tax=Chenopodium quinoa TaxID=63459 RepID=UPI000B76FB3D|nr:LEAF RUST 10 DISEASE-RESISTANCE LOCUS RECEPTOR-LIKE PROTEIN KINASE-like 1.2 [Chenopodium quinoa]
MASYCFLLHFSYITLVIFLTFSLCNGQSPQYAACSLKFSCGKIRNIGYPFWGDNRPSFCGDPNLKLLCRNNSKYPVLNVFQGHVHDYAKLSVRRINMSSRTMVLSQYELLGHCYSDSSNRALSYSTLLKPLSGCSNIRLFYNCKNCSVYNTHHNSFSCNKNNIDYVGNNNSFDTAYYFGKNKSCTCSNNFTFVVDTKVLDELKNTDASLLTIFKKNPTINLEYTANFTACSKCEESGGRCGSSGNLSEDKFVCYCRDGYHQSLVCPKPENKDIGIANRQKKKKDFVIGIGGGLLVLVLICIAIWYRNKKMSDHLKFRTRSASLDSNASDVEFGSKFFGVPLFSYNQLVEATADFDQSNELGSGGFGTVYYGKLKDGREVAVKRLYEKNYKILEQFINEIQILTRLRNNNLVLLHGCTSHHSRELLLVYEYVENGTVADHLYGENTKSGFLPWPVRLRIAIETATALSYLHASDIIHRDVKTNNILLDSNFSVKVADFGLSRLFPTDKTHVSTVPQGTPGYLDPEYHQCYQLTNKSDVYSFGVVLIELISSLPAVDMERHRLEINLSNYAMDRIQRCAFDELVDPKLGFTSDFKVRRMTILVAELAFQCLQHDKEFRPSMDEVLEVLKKIETADYEALQAEDMTNNAAEEVVKMHNINPPLSSPTEDDHAQLLSNHHLNLSSPISVIDKWKAALNYTGAQGNINYSG